MLWRTELFSGLSHVLSFQRSLLGQHPYTAPHKPVAATLGAYKVLLVTPALGGLEGGPKQAWLLRWSGVFSLPMPLRAPGPGRRQAQEEAGKEDFQAAPQNYQSSPTPRSAVHLPAGPASGDLPLGLGWALRNPRHEDVYARAREVSGVGWPMEPCLSSRGEQQTRSGNTRGGRGGQLAPPSAHALPFIPRFPSSSLPP